MREISKGKGILSITGGLYHSGKWYNPRLWGRIKGSGIAVFIQHTSFRRIDQADESVLALKHELRVSPTELTCT